MIFLDRSLLGFLVEALRQRILGMVNLQFLRFVFAAVVGLLLFFDAFLFSVKVFFDVVKKPSFVQLV
jgi:hypothetical protein